ncbi:hypothetical protein SK128_003728 [Halocaridina rubra]|uniref:Uncharacterized protein n=1 Tax=Halocaridina rubra TaxID=373956 RepID=A0AAN8XUV0_HALRR
MCFHLLVMATASITVLLLTLVSFVMGAAVLREDGPCARYCTNRFGKRICCEGVRFHGKPRCPPAPRILMDCTAEEEMSKHVKVTECQVDDECGTDELCCSDICHDGPAKICMPSVFNNLHLFSIP